MKIDPQFHIPVWGGIECSINRVENIFYDQLEMNNFYTSNAHIKSILACNIKSVRFPVLWEKHEPIKDDEINWEWAVNELQLLKVNKVEPIVGLLHHGSGPSFTNLLDKSFPELFAAYAAKVAKKFPWINYYNPINEPLTTARFSGLYGLWYPHKKNDVSFIQALLNQLKGIVLAMKEIRKINPSAHLVQTEDLSKTYSTDVLNYQADFENARRWLTYDILLGKFTDKHLLWKYFIRLGIKTEALQFFIENPCDISLLGANYYITSERFLDEQINNYPSNTHGGNTLHTYADVEAVRIKLNAPHGLGHLLEELWNRYHLPIAITEAHLHCYREEQIRWLKHVYEEAVLARKKGIEIVAVTSWALFGSFGWDKLLTSFPGNYETGAIDNSSGKIRFTAVSNLIKSLNINTDFFTDLLPENGWWHSENRFINPLTKQTSKQLSTGRPLIILGKSGTLGTAFSKICIERRWHYHIFSRLEVDITNVREIENMLSYYKPWALINATGFVDIDRAENEKKKCYKINNVANKNVGILCKEHQVKFITFSTDQVFDGETFEPYSESSLPNPLNVYGHSKMLAENFLIQECPSALVIRTSSFFGPWDHYNFLTQCMQALQQGQTFEASADTVVSPTYLPHLVNACLDLMLDDAEGIWHLVNNGETTWYEWAKKLANTKGLDERLVKQKNNKLSAATRPKYSVLTSEKYYSMPTLECGMAQYLESKFETIDCLQLKN